MVYRAVDSANRNVALKVLKKQLNESRRARFKREGEVAARLKHPGILAIHGGGEQRGFPFLVYDLVEDAKELDVYLRDRPVNESARVLASVAEAVGAAHAKGVVHRDLKAANVLVDGQGRARVADFGLASSRNADHLTKTGAILGTPVAMAPEQIAGRNELVGPHTDVWALGVMLYEALCGRIPFFGQNWFELQAQILGVNPPSLRSIAPNVPADLEAICLKALAKEVDDRYTDGAAMAADLEAFLSGARPSASRHWTSLGLRSPALRRLLLLALPLVVAACAVVAALLTSTPPKPVTVPTKRAPVAKVDSVFEGEAAEALVAVRRTEVPRERIAAARDWLNRFPGREGVSRVEAILERDSAKHPLVRFVHDRRSEVIAGFLDRRTVFTVGSEGTVAGWDLDTGREVWRHFLSMGDGSLVAAARVAGPAVAMIALQMPLTWATSEGIVPDAGYPGATSLAASRDGNTLAIGLYDHSIALFDTTTRTEVRRLPIRHLPVVCMAFSRDGRKLVVASGNQAGLLAQRNSPQSVGRGGAAELSVFDLESPEAVPGVYATRGLARALAFVPGVGHLLLGTAVGEIQVWDLERGEEVGMFERRTTGEGVSGRGAAHAGSVRDFVFVRDGKTLLSVAMGELKESDQIAAWDVATRAPLGVDRVLSASPLGLELSPDGRDLLVATRTGVAEIYALPPSVLSGGVESPR